jgi:hypothetical protein
MEKVVQNFKSSRMQSLNMFGRRECFLFEFESLSGVWKFENLFDRAGPTSQRPTSVSNHVCRHRSSSLLMTSRPYPMLRGGGGGSLPFPFLLLHYFGLSPPLCLACACRSARRRAPPYPTPSPSEPRNLTAISR